MMRQGWAFGLGLFVSGVVLAQPPADSERYPPAPDLPGIVVGQTQSSRPIGKIVPIGGQGEKQILAEPAPVPKAIEKAPEAAPSAVPAPTEKLIAPVEPMPVQAACPVPSQGLGLGTGKHLDAIHRLQEWLCFRSRARQSGCYVTPYRPPLQAWFPCEERRPSCGTCASGQGVHGGKHHSKTMGAPNYEVMNPTRILGAPRYEVVNPVPVVVPPPVEKPVPPEKPPVSPMPKSGSSTLTPIPPPPLVESDLPQGFQKVDVGLSFTPGVAPIAKPTTQTDRVSKWRPK